jgi:hypothetical protein
MDEPKDATSQVPEAVAKATAEALAKIKQRTFAGRHPELGKMINCHVCGQRHRETHMIGKDVVQCEIRYAKGSRYDMMPESEKKEMVIEPATMRQLMGARHFAKKRRHPHPSKRNLQLVQCTQQNYPRNEPFYTDPKECMEAARTEALRELKAERRVARRAVRRQTQISRRINLGFAKPGARL